MLLLTLFVAAFSRSLASPANPVPSPLCAIAAAVTTCTCDVTKTRSLLEIIYSCLGVILLCTYISIHHNIPDQQHSAVKAAWIKITTTFYALLIPEIVIMWALRQRIGAGVIARQNADRGWTLTHGFFVQMGGLMMECSRMKWDKLDTEHQEILSHYAPNHRLPEHEQTYSVILPSDGLSKLSLPRIAEKEIRDHGKGDFLAKALVIIQTGWFVMHCIARHVYNLGLTEIELVTLAFAALNFFTYILWWNKPLNVGYPIYVDYEGRRVDGPMEEPEHAWYMRAWRAMKGCVHGWSKALLDNIEEDGLPFTIFAGIIWTFLGPVKVILDAISHMAGESQSQQNKLGATSVSIFFAAEMPDIMWHEDRWLTILFSALIGVLFGGIHLIGWNFRCPSLLELWLWRGCSLAITAIPLFIAIASALYIMHIKYPAISIYETISGLLFAPSLAVGLPLYFGARLVLLALALLSLRALPASSFQHVKWVDYIPHI